jgi:hypothetical protein
VEEVLISRKIYLNIINYGNKREPRFRFLPIENAFCFLLSLTWQSFGLKSRVARWCIFKPKIPIWVNFGAPLNKKYWHIL